MPPHLKVRTDPLRAVEHVAVSRRQRRSRASQRRPIIDTRHLARRSGFRPDQSIHIDRIVGMRTNIEIDDELLSQAMRSLVCRPNEPPWKRACGCWCGCARKPRHLRSSRDWGGKAIWRRCVGVAHDGGRNFRRQLHLDRICAAIERRQPPNSGRRQPGTAPDRRSHPARGARDRLLKFIERYDTTISDSRMAWFPQDETKYNPVEARIIAGRQVTLLKTDGVVHPV